MPNQDSGVIEDGPESGLTESVQLHMLRNLTDGEAVIGNPKGEKSEKAELQISEVADTDAGEIDEEKIAFTIIADDLEQSATIVVEEPDWLNARR